MATSEEKGLIEETTGLGAPYDRTWRVRANNPLHVDWVRTLVNNWHHAYDMSTQHRVSFVPVAISGAGLRPSHTFAAADTYEHFRSFGPFPWAIRHDRVFMRPVFRVAGAVDNAAYTLTYKVVFTLAALAIRADGGLASSEASTSSTTEGWLTFPGTYLTPVPDSGYAQGVSTVPTVDYVDGVAHAASAQWVQCRLDIFVKTDDDAATAYLSGVHLREFIGE